MRRALAVSVLLLALAPAGASAGTVTVEVVREDQGHMTVEAWRTVRYAAAAGEANRVTLTLAADAVTLRDDGADVAAPAECTRIDARAVTCPAGPIPGGYAAYAHPHVVVDAGDGDDVVVADGAGHVDVDGGDGDDALTGGAEGDTLRGGPGADVVSGGPGEDSFGDAADGAADRYEGGDGADVLRRGGTDPWRVDLAAGTAATGAERDAIAGLEHVIGGRGRDTLLGTDGADVLDGRGGPDRLDGRGGDDLLLPAITRTFRDLYESTYPWPDRAADRVACGDGDDVVGTLELLDRFSGCETLGTEGDVLRFPADPVAVSDDRVFVSVLPATGSVDARLRLVAGGTVLGATRVRRTGRVAIALTERGRRLLARPGPLRAGIVASERVFLDSGDIGGVRRFAFPATL